MEEKEYRKQIAELLIKNREMGSYIKILETKLNDLESELYFIKRNEKMEEQTVDNEKFHEIEQGLKAMGMKSEDLDELGDLLDEALGKDDKTDEG